MSDHDEHKLEAQRLVIKHMAALYEEVNKEGACHMCVLHGLMASSIANVMVLTPSQGEVFEYMDTAYDTAELCLEQGATVKLGRDKRKMN